MKTHRPTWLPILAATTIAAGSSSAFEIEIDYSLDQNGFFDSPESRAALRAVCDFYESIITDDLAAIDPTTWPTGDKWFAFRMNPVTRGFDIVENLVIPEDTYVLYAGGTALGGLSGYGTPGQAYNVEASQATLLETWTLVTGRGQEGADRFVESPTDYTPWGGTVTFDTGREWNFSTTGPDDTMALEFIPVALHELAHALGVGTASTWNRYVDKVGLLFNGPHSMEAYGAAVPMIEEFHWADDVRSPSLAMFGIPGGVETIPVMNRFSPVTNAKAFRGLSELDLAGLADIGWQVQDPPLPPPTGPKEAVVSVTGTEVSISFIAEVGKTYTIEQSTTLTEQWNTKEEFEGDGTRKVWVDPQPAPKSGYYRLVTTGEDDD
ncbi:MAG: hypothetical protein ACSHYF_10660 [Verrucomicrobiaceae bacterium]